MIAEQHPNRGVYDLGGDSIPILVRHARVRIPSAAMQLLEFDAEQRQLVRRLAGRGDEAHRYWPLHPFDHEQVAFLVVVDQMGRAISEPGVDKIDVGVWRFGDMRIRRDDWLL